MLLVLIQMENKTIAGLIMTLTGGSLSLSRTDWDCPMSSPCSGYDTALSTEYSGHWTEGATDLKKGWHNISQAGAVP